MILKEGEASVCRDSVAVRKVTKSHQKHKNKELQHFQKFRPDVIRKLDEKRVTQNKKLYLDEEYNLVPDNLAVYKNVHVYKPLYKGMYFGGRALLADYGNKLIMRQI